ncbi:hypothetical protein KKA15_05905 [Patescibacteria group bacterium]|nr:hypothetical protein [Patescibacteria group bacterium]
MCEICTESHDYVGMPPHTHFSPKIIKALRESADQWVEQCRQIEKEHRQAINENAQEDPVIFRTA